ncbi:PBP1A family penicillin-binding protein [Patescibacteria group bacterium]|nr:PBP1A family penicillin-binding protein [Patescibacteria group bacterium]
MSLSRIILLFIKLILIKIGNAPIGVFQFTIKIFQKILNSASYILHSTRHRRTAGRPKKLRFSTKSKIILGSLALVVFLFFYTVFILTAAYQLPDPTRLSQSFQPLTTEIYDRNGNLLYRFYEDKNRTLVKFADVPKYLTQATIAIEDRNFYHHIGIDPVAILRAFYHNLRNGGYEGASTITQQLIKNSLLTPEKTYTRKLKEIILALWTERIYSKDEILQMYFNEAPYGGTNIGISAAALTYFGKSPKKLTLAEAAYLAGLPASPTQFFPYGLGAPLAKERQSQVLQRMVQEKYITASQAEQAYSEELTLLSPTDSIRAPHFVMYIRDQLTSKFGQRVVTQGGLKVITSLDLKIQETVESIIKEELEKLTSLNVQNGAAMVMDTEGQILAMVGSKDYFEPKFGNFNVALALRQPGSSIKVITYAAAFKKGFSPGNTILDAPVAFKDGDKIYAPQNYDGKYHGPVSIRTALGSSYNIPAVKILSTVGIEEMLKTAKDLGITTFNEPERYGLSLTLGGGEIKMIDMMTVYGTLANLGYKRYQTEILKVTDSYGNVLKEIDESGKQVLQKEVAFMITDILKDNKARTPAFGPNSLLSIPGYEVAVKTGTSDNKRDNWTFGYTPKFVVGVWVGNPDNSPMNPVLTSGVTGAAPIWNRIMHMLLDETKPLAFEKPSGIIEAVVDGRKDLVLSGNLPKAMVRVQKSEDKLVYSDGFSSYATSSAQTNPAQPNP